MMFFEIFFCFFSSFDFFLFCFFFFFYKLTLTPEVKKSVFTWTFHEVLALFFLLQKERARTDKEEVRAAAHGCCQGRGPWLGAGLAEGLAGLCCCGSSGAQGELAGLMVGLLASERL